MGWNEPTNPNQSITRHMLTLWILKRCNAQMLSFFSLSGTNRKLIWWSSLIVLTLIFFQAETSSGLLSCLPPRWPSEHLSVYTVMLAQWFEKMTPTSYKTPLATSRRTHNFELNLSLFSSLVLPEWGIVMVSLALGDPTLKMTTAEALWAAAWRILSL